MKTFSFKLWNPKMGEWFNTTPLADALSKALDIVPGSCSWITSSGFNDASGKDVFEMDILRRTTGDLNVLWLVYWDDNKGGFFAKSTSNEVVPLYSLCPEKFNVVGNIFENKVQFGCYWPDADTIGKRVNAENHG